MANQDSDEPQIDVHSPRFIPATEWSGSPYYVKKSVMSWLPVEERVAFERVDKTCSKISNDLFLTQKYISKDATVTDAIKRCPNLVELDFQSHICDEFASRYDLTDNLFQWCPKIRSFNSIIADDLLIVTSYLSKYRASSDFNDSSFNGIDFYGVYPHAARVMYELINYKIKWIKIPRNLNAQNYGIYADYILEIPPENIEKITINFNYDENNCNPFSCLSIVRKIISREKEEEKLFTINLKSFSGILDQEIFDLLTNCGNLKTLIIGKIYYYLGIKYLDISNLIKLTNLTRLNFFDFEVGPEIDNRNREILINFLVNNGHKLKHLTLSILDPNEKIIRAIKDNCHKLYHLQIEIYSTKCLLEIIPEMKRLRTLIVHHARISEDEKLFISDCIPQLVSLINYPDPEEESVNNRGLISWIKTNYFFPIFVIGHISLVLFFK